MFRAKTLFVLGAGSSNEVGLPLGETLKIKIADNLNIAFPGGIRQASGHHGIMQAIRQHITEDNNDFSNDPNPYLESAWKLREALPQAISIDNLLDAYKDDKRAELCGKLGIVASILEAERASDLYFNPSEQQNFNLDKLSNTWFSSFVKLLTEDVSKIDISELFSNVSFINFNYDRCLEQYLYHAIKIYYSISHEEAIKIVNSLEIYRPYGSLGKLDWQQRDSENVSFGKIDHRLLPLSKKIKTFNERVYEESILNNIRTSFKEAEVIVFLGFAFRRQNLEILNSDSAGKAKRIYATAHGISRSDCRVIENEIIKLMGKNDNNTSIEMRRDLTCSQLFSEYWRSLTAE